MEKVCYAQSNPKAALVWTTLAFFTGFAGVSAFGPIVSKLKETMELSPLLMGFLGASPALTGSLLRVPFGALVDRMGGKKPIQILLGLTCLGIAAITSVFYFGPVPGPGHLIVFFICGMLCGCGIATFSVGIPAVSYWHPQKRQGIALALYGGLGNLAPGIFAFVLPFLVLHTGFAASYVMWLIFLFLVLLLFSFFMKDAPYFQYRGMGIDIDKEALLFACGEELIPTGTMMASIRKAAGDYRTWILTAFYFVSFGGFIALTVWFPTYWKEYFGVSLVYAGLLTALYSLSTSVLRVLGGVLSDRNGGERVVAGSFLIITAGAVLLTLPYGSFGAAVTGQLLLAAGMGFANAAVFKLVPKFTPAAVGGTAGIIGGLGAFGGFVIPIFMGLCVRSMGRSGYAFGFMIFVVLSVVSLVLFVLLRSRKERQPPATTPKERKEGKHA
jgi:NNP family nitrate/nitrite transporter-like MFS transporter